MRIFGNICCVNCLIILYLQSIFNNATIYNMEITLEEQTLIDCVTQVSCSIFNVNVEEIFKRNTTQQAKKARNLSMLILHTEYNLSIGKLALTYKIGRRNVFKKIAKVKFLTEHDITYKEAISVLRGEIKKHC